jgi:Papain-like cysteine protease AvrRpt2
MLARREIIRWFGVGAATVAVKRAAKAGVQCQRTPRPDVALCEAGLSSVPRVAAAFSRQQASEWCWAACLQMVFSYYGHPVSQSRIVQETWGAIRNLPGQPAQILRDLNRSWTDDNNNAFSVAGSVLNATATTAAQDLSGDMPLIVGTLGHAMLLVDLVYYVDRFGAVSVQRIGVLDPWPYNPGLRQLTPQEGTFVNFLARVRVSD